jgi:tetratricopeptide (TPR) repeat protein
MVSSGSSEQGRKSPFGLIATLSIVAVVIGGVGWWIARNHPSGAVAQQPAATLSAGEGPTHNQILTQADEYQRTGNLEMIASTLPAFIGQHPHDLTVRLRYASVLAQMKNFDAALEQYQEILKLDPDYLQARIGVARVTSWKGQLQPALGMYDAVLAADPKNYEARVGKAYTLMWMLRDAEAKSLFEAALGDHPEDAEIANALKSLRAREKKKS